MSDRARVCPLCGDPRLKAAFHERMAWIIVFLLSIPSLLGVFWALFLATGISAPQQAATIAGCLGMTVIPYCYARAVEKY